MTAEREGGRMTEERIESKGLPEGMFTLNTDGGIVAAPNQPEGEAAIGVIVTDPDGKVFAEVSARLGWCRDHHVAEFHALTLGLTMAKQFGIESLVIKTDSELVHHTMNGTWKLRPQHLRDLRDRAQELWTEMGSPDISWVPREQNAAVDRLAGKLLGPLRPKPDLSGAVDPQRAVDGGADGARRKELAAERGAEQQWRFGNRHTPSL